MIWPEMVSKKIPTAAALIVNFLISWTVLPLVVPPFGAYSFRELMEVLLWQGIAALGWPLAVLGGFANFILQGNASDLAALLLVLIYPAMLLLLLLVLFSKRFSRRALVFLHILLAFSFAAVWYQVLNGYDFMVG